MRKRVAWALSALSVIALVAPTLSSESVGASVTTTTRAAALLYRGSHGAAVTTLQRRLAALGYWVGPATGVFNDATQQAVFAVQKVAGVSRDGVVGPITAAALVRGVRPVARSHAGYVVEINLRTNVLELVRDGRVLSVLNVSSGGGYRYESEGSVGVAVTPTGKFRLFRQVNGLDVSPLGELWRPKYFTGGYAIHGAASVPPYPVSHGCVRVSIEAMDWLWASKRLPLGTAVWVY